MCHKTSDKGVHFVSDFIRSYNYRNRAVEAVYLGVTALATRLSVWAYNFTSFQKMIAYGSSGLRLYYCVPAHLVGSIVCTLLAVRDIRSHASIPSIFPWGVPVPNLESLPSIDLQDHQCLRSQTRSRAVWK